MFEFLCLAVVLFVVYRFVPGVKTKVDGFIASFKKPTE